MNHNYRTLIATCLLIGFICAKMSGQRYPSYQELVSLKIVSDTTVLTSSTSSVMHNKNSFIKQGFFCRGEDYISRDKNVQLRFRLGSLDYVDRLENKVPLYRKPN